MTITFTVIDVDDDGAHLIPRNGFDERWVPHACFKTGIWEVVT